MGRLLFHPVHPRIRALRLQVLHHPKGLGIPPISFPSRLQMISHQMSHFQKRTRFFLGAPVAALLFLGLTSPAAYSQSRVLSEGIESLIRMAAKARPNIQPTFKIIAQGVAVVNTANGAYNIYIDCRAGMASSSLFNLPRNQQLSLVGQMCSNLRTFH
jgi:hypothetical protein